MAHLRILTNAVTSLGPDEMIRLDDLQELARGRWLLRTAIAEVAR